MSSIAAAFNLRTVSENGILWEVDDNRKDANRARASRLHFPACEHCGNPVKAGQGWIVVVVGGGSSLVHTDDVERAEALSRGPVDGADEDARRSFSSGFMGAYLLGPRCGTKFPREYRTNDTAAFYDADGTVARGYC